MSETKAVGQPVARIDALAKVTGQAHYPGDFKHARNAVDEDPVRRTTPRAHIAHRYH